MLLLINMRSLSIRYSWKVSLKIRFETFHLFLTIACFVQELQNIELYNVIQLSSWTVSLVTFVKTEIVRQCLWIIPHGHGQHFLSILLSRPNKFSRIWKSYRYYIYFHQTPRWIAICEQWNRFQGNVEATGVESGSLGWWGWNDEITHSLNILPNFCWVFWTQGCEYTDLI